MQTGPNLEMPVQPSTVQFTSTLPVHVIRSWESAMHTDQTPLITIWNQNQATIWQPQSQSINHCSIKREEWRENSHYRFSVIIEPSLNQQISKMLMT